MEISHSNSILHHEYCDPTNKELLSEFIHLLYKKLNS